MTDGDQLSDGEMMRCDLYQLLGVECGADLKTIKRAYRKRALQCHPDKNRDNPQAAELFHKLSRVLEILADTEARAAYDKLWRARRATEQRTRAYDSQRKRLKCELEERERAAAAAAASSSSAPDAAVSAVDEAQLQRTIERLRREGSQQLRAEQQLLRQQLQEERAAAGVDRVGEEDSRGKCRVKVRWNVSLGHYDSASLTALMSKYGRVVCVAVSSRPSAGSALVEFAEASAAANAVLFERGRPAAPLKVRPLIAATNTTTTQTLDDQTAVEEEQAACLSRRTTLQNQSDGVAATSTSNSSRAAFDTFESMVLRNLRQATEQQQHQTSEAGDLPDSGQQDQPPPSDAHNFPDS